MQIHIQSSFFQSLSGSTARDNRTRNSLESKDWRALGRGPSGCHGWGVRLDHLFHHEARTHIHSFHLSSLSLSHTCRLSHSLSHTNFHSHKISPSAAASLWANSVCIPFQPHLWETDKTICQITLAESHSDSHTRIHTQYS